MNTQNIDIAIIGGGLSGLALGFTLQRAEADWHLFEAQPRIGGRVMSSGSTNADMGPGWTWPGDKRVAALAEALGLRIFPQYAAGNLVFEDASGTVRRDMDMALMAGARRIEGGMAALTAGLHALLEESRVMTGAGVTEIRKTDEGFALALTTGTTVHARRVVLALPPRVALQTINGLAPLTARAAGQIPTWMAGQSKAAAIYDRPFWRGAGLSGEAISHKGPLAQIHDASPFSGAEGALIGFLAARPVTQADIIRQLTALFGPEAATPREVIIQDWALVPQTTSDADRAAQGQPHPHMALAIRGDAHLIWAGAEAATENTGLLEGALAAADHAAAVLFNQASNDQNDNALA